MITGTTPVQKVQKNKTTLFAFYFLFTTVVVTKILQLYTRQPIQRTLIAGVVDIITLIIHMILVMADPGYIINTDIDFLKLLELFDSSSLCPECHTIRTPRSRHCIICHRCVDRYDHHCPWVNNCVGLRNHNLFLSYLVFQFISLAISIGQTTELIFPCIEHG